METIAPFKLWICLATVGCVLGTVTGISIHGGPSARNAIVAIRVAHLELSWARISFRDPAVHEAESHLDQAWSNLRDRRYEESFSAAHEALQRVRDITGGSASLYGSRRNGKKSDPGNSAKS
jgi:hypothetical protein